ncbi:hypothetical protein B0T22DRAFT_376783 [Podospora appendiculata]|uniref:Macro domain-containing protein n=1 Tax=Podospora appendiculata TaxID=314037 RepID=A0AAE0X8J4_9PEZI|nr:hypothetical protein B0T22DRAFT_376783 [Podospora appendiculata]
MTIIEARDIPTLPLLYKLKKLTAVEDGTNLPGDLVDLDAIPEPSNELNGRIGYIRSDITKMRVDAIVNAAKQSLLGGGGIDGVIHRNAGPDLVKECRTLGGCPTGSAKITDAYQLPCKKVIHTVGPIYSPSSHAACEEKLASCYATSLAVAAANGCRTIVFPCVSTGIYGYYSELAAPVALSAIRKFLVQDTAHRIDKVVICTFEQKDVIAYNKFIPYYFPPQPEDTPSQKKDGETGDQIAPALAQSLAEALPSPPTTEPSNPEHVGKKQKLKQGDETNNETSPPPQKSRSMLDV